MGWRDHMEFGGIWEEDFLGWRSDWMRMVPKGRNHGDAEASGSMDDIATHEEEGRSLGRAGVAKEMRFMPAWLSFKCLCCVQPWTNMDPLIFNDH